MSAGGSATIVSGHVSLSDEACRIFGVQPLDLPQWQERWVSLIHPEDREKTAAASEMALRGGPRYDVEYRVVRPDGTVRVVHSQGDVTRDESGRPVRQFGVMQDITELRHAEEECARARRASARSSTTRRTPSSCWTSSSNVVDVNRQACESLGWSREELIGMHPREFDVGWTSRPSRGSRSAPAQGKSLPSRRAIGARTARHSPSRSAPARSGREGSSSTWPSRATSASASSPRRTLREKDDALQMARTELAHVSRLTTLGELTTSIAHEVSQPLGAMVASAGACARWLAADPPAMAEARSALDNIVADGKRAREVIARIRALTKRQVPRMDLLDLNRKILEVLALTEQELRSHDIVLGTKLDSTLPQVMGDRVQLQQVLFNLILNAIEAMSAVNDRPRELTIVSAQGSGRRGGRGTRFRHRARSGSCGASLRGVLHDQSRRHRHRLVDQPLDRRGARWAALGGPERASWGGLPVLAPGCRGPTIMSEASPNTPHVLAASRRTQFMPPVSQTAARVP